MDAVEHMEATRVASVFSPGEELETAAYLALGLSGEAGELASDVTSGSPQVVYELGDVNYYLSRLCDLLNIEPVSERRIAQRIATQNPNPSQHPHYEILVSASRVAESVKKMIRDGTFEDKESWLPGIQDALEHIAVNLARVAFNHGLTMDEARRLNIEKCMRRIKNGTTKGSGDR